MNAMGDTNMKLATAQKLDQAKVLREKLQDAGEVNRGGRIFIGSVLIVSALGLWLVPANAGDTGMQLIKLLVSVVLVVPGMMFIFSLRQREDLPEVQINLTERELQILKRDRTGANYVEASHGFDTLSEVTLRDRFLTARDAVGRTVVSVPLRDEATEAALKEALQGVT